MSSLPGSTIWCTGTRRSSLHWRVGLQSEYSSHKSADLPSPTFLLVQSHLLLLLPEQSPGRSHKALKMSTPTSPVYYFDLTWVIHKLQNLKRLEMSAATPFRYYFFVFFLAQSHRSTTSTRANHKDPEASTAAVSPQTGPQYKIPFCRISFDVMIYMISKWFQFPTIGHCG